MVPTGRGISTLGTAGDAAPRDNVGLTSSGTDNGLGVIIMGAPAVRLFPGFPETGRFPFTSFGLPSELGGKRSPPFQYLLLPLRKAAAPLPTAAPSAAPQDPSSAILSRTFSTTEFTGIAR